VEQAPEEFSESLAYKGLPLWDSDQLGTFVQERHARKIAVQEMAELLVSGKIVGVVRGRQEFGPRALGHRSLLATPRKEMRSRLNKLKRRQWYRPVAPMIAVEVCVLQPVTVAM